MDSKQDRRPGGGMHLSVFRHLLSMHDIKLPTLVLLPLDELLQSRYQRVYALRP